MTHNPRFTVNSRQLMLMMDATSFPFTCSVEMAAAHFQQARLSKSFSARQHRQRMPSTRTGISGSESVSSGIDALEESPSAKGVSSVRRLVIRPSANGIHNRSSQQGQAIFDPARDSGARRTLLQCGHSNSIGTVVQASPAGQWTSRFAFERPEVNAQY